MLKKRLSFVEREISASQERSDDEEHKRCAMERLEQQKLELKTRVEELEQEVSCLRVQLEDGKPSEELSRDTTLSGVEEKLRYFESEVERLRERCSVLEDENTRLQVGLQFMINYFANQLID